MCQIMRLFSFILLLMKLKIHRKRGWVLIKRNMVYISQEKWVSLPCSCFFSEQNSSAHTQCDLLDQINDILCASCSEYMFSPAFHSFQIWLLCGSPNMWGWEMCYHIWPVGKWLNFKTPYLLTLASTIQTTVIYCFDFIK